MLQVFVDFKSPAAYLALKPTRALASDLGLTVIWRPIKTTQHAVPQIQPDEDQGTSHRRVRAQARQQVHLHYASIQSLPMRFPTRFCETDLALGVLDALSCETVEVVDAFVTAAFEAYWSDHADLDQGSVVAGVLSACEMKAGLTDEVQKTLPARLSSIAAVAHEAGVVDAPAYLVEGQVLSVESICLGYGNC